MIAHKYNICHVSISDLLNKEIRLNNDNSPLILNHMNGGELSKQDFIININLKIKIFPITF